MDNQELVSEVLEDFKRRQNERKPYEANWQLNMNFLMGNQYCEVGFGGEVEEYEKQFFWQEREVYNHIAPTLDIRLAKLQKVRPTMAVMPSSTDDSDIKTAKLCKKILNSIYSRYDISNVINEATKWSEVTGTSFYKVIWDDGKGEKIANVDKEVIHLGDIDISVCSPFEIYPDNTCTQKIDDCQSIIHAKAYHVDEIKRLYNIEVKGEDVNVFSLDNTQLGVGGLGYNSLSSKVISGVKSNHAIVIEKYVKPTVDYPNGRLIIVVGETLVYDGELPFINRANGERGFPFIKQESIEQTGCFWGTGIVDRLIPVQRAYNAVKNRKQPPHPERLHTKDWLC